MFLPSFHAVVIAILITANLCLSLKTLPRAVGRDGAMAVSPINGHIFTLEVAFANRIGFQNATEWDTYLNPIAQYVGLALIAPNRAVCDRDHDRIIWILDDTHNIVLVNVTNGTVIPFAKGAVLDFAQDITIDFSGDILVTNIDNKLGNQVLRFNPLGQLVAQYKISDFPQSIFTDAKGFIYVTLSSSIVQLSSDGEVVQYFTLNPSLKSPQGIDINSDYDLIFGDFGNKGLVQIDQKGALVNVWDKTTPQMNQTGNFSSVTTVEIFIVRLGKNGVIVVKDFSVGRILCIPPYGTLTTLD